MKILENAFALLGLWGEHVRRVSQEYLMNNLWIKRTIVAGSRILDLDTVENGFCEAVWYFGVSFLKVPCWRIPTVVQWANNLTAATGIVAKVQVQSLAWFSGLRICCCTTRYGIGYMWLRASVAVAQIQPLTQELPHALGVPLKKKKNAIQL